MLWHDHVKEKKDSFLQFGQNNGIVTHNGIFTHFTNKKDGVAKEMNRALLEKVQYLLSNALLDSLD